MFKEHAGGAVQLRHDHALGAVDDERALAGHQGHFAHIDLLLFDFLDHLVLRSRRLAVINNQLYFGTHCRRKRQPAGLALAHIERGFSEVVLKVFHLHKTVVGDDRESGFKGRLQAFIGPLFGCHVGLKKRGVSVLLHLQQVGNFEHAVAVTEIFANSLAFCVCVSH